MKNTIDIGTIIDLDDLIESRMLIQANSGGGKSGIARVTMEESLGKIPFIVLERKGEYYTLKEKFPDIMVIGGRNGDIPISMQAAPKLARFIVSHQLTVVIDMSSLEGDDQRAVFVKEFLKGLMNLTEELWCRYLVFLEEAHIFCGQQEKTPSAKYVKLLMSEGRKMGFAGILLTQRISKLHKDAAAECNNKFIGRTFLDLDINRSASEMGLAGQEKFKLRDLKPQHFWAFGTSIHPHHVHEVVIKNAQTKFPKAGVQINMANVKPAEKVKKALAKLNELPAEAAKELKDIKDLQAEVKRLETELKKKPGAAVTTQTNSAVSLLSPKDVNLIAGLRSEVSLLKEQAKIKDRSITLHKKAIGVYETRVTDFSAQLMRIADKLTNSHGVEFPELLESKTELSDFGTSVQKNGTKKRESVQAIGAGGIKEVVRVPTKDVLKWEAPASGKLPPGEQAVLIACAQFGHAMDRNQLTVLTGYKKSSRDAYIARLKEKGFIESDGSKVVATDAGISFLGNSYQPLPTGEALQEYWLGKLPIGEKAVLESLIKNYPNPVPRDLLSTETGYKKSSRDAYLARMASKELVVMVGRGEVRASANLFDY